MKDLLLISRSLLSSRAVCNRRKLSTSVFRAATSNPHRPPPQAYSFLPNRRLLLISGPDSTRYLQGATTANVASNSTDGFYAAFLNAQGRILNDVFVYRYQGSEGQQTEEPAWLVEVDAKQVESLASRINRYKLSSKFKVRVLPMTEKGVWSVWDDTSENIRALLDPGYMEGIIGCTDMRAPDMGHRLLLPGNKKPELDMEEVHEDCYRLRRYLKGVPEGQDELVPEQAFPQESNIDFMGGIDYHKGCYIGQELTIRTHHTGVVRKRILPVQVYGVHETEPQELTYNINANLGVTNIPIENNISPWGKSGRGAGKWLNGIGNIGLGICRLKTMTNFSDGELSSYQPGDEFKLEWKDEEGEKALKIKAFVPKWWPLIK